MASIIRIKRSATSGDPSTLGTGELAYSALTGTQSNGGDRLYIGFGNETAGNAASHFVIGGKYFTDMLDHVHGTLTADSAIIVDDQKRIDELNVDNITLNGNTISTGSGNLYLDPVGSNYVQAVGTNFFVIPVGTTAQQSVGVDGGIRLNSETGQYEGYSNGNWSSLGGVRSVDGLTYITAESAPSSSDDTLRFYTDGTLRMSLDTDSLDIGTSIIVNIDNTTQSTSTSTGALVVDGGVGIAKNLYVGGDFNIAGAQVVSGDFGINGGDLYSTATTFNLLNQDGALSGSNDGPTTVNAFLNAATISMGASTGTTTINNNTTVTGDLTVTSNTIKSSSATAITLSGADVTVAGDLTVTGNDIFSSGAKAITLTNADVNVLGDLDVDVNLNVDGTAQIDGATTIGASGTRAALTVYGTTVSITGSDTTTIGVEAATASAITFELKATNTVGDANLDVNVDDAFTLDATTVSIDSTDNSNFSMTANSAATKSLTIDAVNAGAGTAEINVGSANTDAVNITSSGSVDVTTGQMHTTVTDLVVEANTVAITTTGTGNNTTLTGGELIVNVDAVTLRGTEGAGDNMTINMTGQLNVDNVRIDGNTIYSTDETNTLYLDPAPIGENTGLVVIKGNLQVDGTTTTINSTQVTIDDPIFTLGGDTVPTTSDNLDRGIKFNWYDTAADAAKIGFFGYDDSATEFVFIANASETGSTFEPASPGVFGNLRFGRLTLVDGTASTTTSSGALVVSGGVGIGGQLNVAGTTNKFTSTQASSSTTTGAVVISGGVGVGGNIYVGDDVIGAGAATSNLDGFNIDGGTY